MFYRILQFAAELIEVIFRDNFLIQQIDQRIRQIRFTKFHLNTQTLSILTDASIQLPELIRCQTIPVQQINILMIQLVGEIGHFFFGQDALRHALCPLLFLGKLFVVAAQCSEWEKIFARF